MTRSGPRLIEPSKDKRYHHVMYRAEGLTMDDGEKVYVELADELPAHVTIGRCRLVLFSDEDDENGGPSPAKAQGRPAENHRRAGSDDEYYDF